MLVQMISKFWLYFLDFNTIFGWVFGHMQMQCFIRLLQLLCELEVAKREIFV